MSNESIVVRGARVHNLKGIDFEIPHNTMTVITGVSGSGKSSLAFDTIYAEGQRRYVESLSAYARQFLGQLEKPDVDHIDGLSPAVSIDQKGVSRNPRSTVGTVTEIYDYLRLLFANIGVPHCHQCGRGVASQTAEPRSHTETVRAGTPRGDGSVTLLPIERVAVHSGTGALGAWFTAAKEPYALVVRDADGIRALDIGATAVSLEALREGIPGLDAVLASM